MARSFVVPDAWQHQDWDSVCERCGQALFLVAIAESRLPSGPIVVTRCPGCMRALWYRSNANTPVVEDYHQRILYATQQPWHWQTDRQPAKEHP